MPQWPWPLLVLALVTSHAMADLRLGIQADEPAPTIARLLVQRLPPELTLDVQVFPDARDIRTALKAGELDLAFLEEPVQDFGGTGIVGALYPSVLHILVNEELPAKSLVDVLTADNIWAGSVGGIGHRLAGSLAGDYGVEEPDLLSDPWSMEPQVYFIFGGLLASDALSRLTAYTLYSLDEVTENDRASVAEGISLRYPNLNTFVLPAQLYPSLSDEPALTLAVNTLLLARDGLSEEVVYDLAMAIDRLKPEIAALYPLSGMEELNRARLATRAMPLHSGARRYADRERPGLVERYAEFVGATVTIAISLVTLGVALYRRRRQARKDRLDTYYQQTLQWREALASKQQSPAEIALALRGLQGEVFELLIAERIDADHALLAFMNLSNQLLYEAELAAKSR